MVFNIHPDFFASLVMMSALLLTQVAVSDKLTTNKSTVDNVTSSVIAPATANGTVVTSVNNNQTDSLKNSEKVTWNFRGGRIFIL